MDFEKYSIEFNSKADEVGYSSENIDKCLRYAKTLFDKNLPVIYNSSHFAGLVGYEKEYINRAIVFTHFFYRHFEIKKNNGGVRKISEPLPSLKEIQTWILHNILYKISASKFAKAYIPGSTLKQNLVFHKGQSIVVNLDIEDFFSNIRGNMVEKLFRHLGYSYFVSNLLSKLCCLNNCLPQGAPTSAYISNLIMVNFDNSIFKYFEGQNIRYTRYADDLSFSGDFDYNVIIKIVKLELKKLSLNLNEEKTKIMRKFHRQTVTGVVVNEKLQVIRCKRKKIRQEIYYIKKFGLKNHMEKRNCSKENYTRHLLGQVLYILFINSDDKEFIEYKNFLTALIQEHR